MGELIVDIPAKNKSFKLNKNNVSAVLSDIKEKNSVDNNEIIILEYISEALNVENEDEFYIDYEGLNHDYPEGITLELTDSRLTPLEPNEISYIKIEDMEYLISSNRLGDFVEDGNLKEDSPSLGSFKIDNWNLIPVPSFST